MPRLAAILALIGLLAGCVAPTDATTSKVPPTQRTSDVLQKRPAAQAPTPVSTARVRQAVNKFAAVAERVTPVGEAECRRRAPRANCRFKLELDPRPDEPANAFQTVDRAGRPVVIFNIALLLEMANNDEVAFVLGHEMAHHTLGHLAVSRNAAQTGALTGAILATVLGAEPGAVDQAAQVGAVMGRQRYSKGFELEADSLGAIIAERAGYDALRGAQYFRRMEDPGSGFLVTHPPNAQRYEVVRRTVAGM